MHRKSLTPAQKSKIEKQEDRRRRERQRREDKYRRPHFEYLAYHFVPFCGNGLRGSRRRS